MEQQLHTEQEERLLPPNTFLKLTYLCRVQLTQEEFQFKSISLLQEPDQTTVFIEFDSEEEAN